MRKNKFIVNWNNCIDDFDFEFDSYEEAKRFKCEMREAFKKAQTPEKYIEISVYEESVYEKEKIKQFDIFTKIEKTLSEFELKYKCIPKEIFLGLKDYASYRYKIGTFYSKCDRSWPDEISSFYSIYYIYKGEQVKISMATPNDLKKLLII